MGSRTDSGNRALLKKRSEALRCAALQLLPAIQVETGQPREAEQSVRRSIELVKRHRPPGHEDLSNSLCRLGDALRCEDRHAEAGAALDECLALIESMKDA